LRKFQRTKARPCLTTEKKETNENVGYHFAAALFGTKKNDNVVKAVICKKNVFFIKLQLSMCFSSN